MNGLAVKNLGNGRIGQLGILFGTKSATDLVREYFEEDTDFWLGAYPKVPMLYDHGMNPALKKAPVIGVWDKLELQAGKGIWFEGELDKAHKYYEDIQKLVDSGALKMSSDSIEHLVVRVPQENGAVKIARWPIAGGSLTTMPCESRMLPVAAVKSLLESINVDPGEKLSEPQTAAIKSNFLGDFIEGDAAIAAIACLNDRLRYGVLWDCFYQVSEGRSTWEEQRKVLLGALAEFGDKALLIADAIMDGKGSETMEAAVKSLAAGKYGLAPATAPSAITPATEPEPQAEVVTEAAKSAAHFRSNLMRSRLRTRMLTSPLAMDQAAA